MSIENGKIYKNWKEVCKALGINYNKSNGNKKKKTIKALGLKYEIIKDGYKMQFNELSNDVIEENEYKLIRDNLISDKFNNASKLFQAELIEFITKEVNNGNTNGNMNMNMYGLLTSMNLLTSNHSKVNYTTYGNEDYNELSNISNKVKGSYMDKYYSDVVRLYERAMDNLVKKKIIYYEKRHNINYKVFKDNELVKEELHKMTSTREETAVRNAERDAWEFIKELFNLHYKKVYKDNSGYHIDFFAMFSDSVNYKCVGLGKSINLSKIGKRERVLVNQFFSKKTYTLYTLFRELANLYIGDILTELGNENEYVVDGYYKAYNIIIEKNLFKKYNKQMIKSILIDNKNKDANADYVIQRMYKSLNKDYYDKAGLLGEIVRVCSYVSPKESNLNEMNEYYRELFNINNVEIDVEIPLNRTLKEV